MLATTIQILKCGLQADPTISAQDRTRLLAVLREPTTPKPTPATPTEPRLLRRAEVARRLSCSLRTVDKLPVKKVKLPGRQRAAGFLESDVNELLTGKETA